MTFIKNIILKYFFKNDFPVSNETEEYMSTEIKNFLGLKKKHIHFGQKINVLDVFGNNIKAIITHIDLSKNIGMAENETTYWLLEKKENHWVCSAAMNKKCMP